MLRWNRQSTRHSGAWMPGQSQGKTLRHIIAVMKACRPFQFQYRLATRFLMDAFKMEKKIAAKRTALARTIFKLFRKP